MKSFYVLGNSCRVNDDVVFYNQKNLHKRHDTNTLFLFLWMLLFTLEVNYLNQQNFLCFILYICVSQIINIKDYRLYYILKSF